MNCENDLVSRLSLELKSYSCWLSTSELHNYYPRGTDYSEFDVAASSFVLMMSYEGDNKFMSWVPYSFSPFHQLIQSHCIFIKKTSFYMVKIDPTSDGVPSIYPQTKELHSPLSFKWYWKGFFQEKIREATWCWKIALFERILKEKRWIIPFLHGIRIYQGLDPKYSSVTSNFSFMSY